MLDKSTKKETKVEDKRVVHNIEPFYDKSSKILILGSFPSIISRKEAFYYANKQNRFWKMLALIFSVKITDKKAFLQKHHIALYDCIYACKINNSSDASIKDVIPTDIETIIKNSSIKHIFLNGTKAKSMFIKYQKSVLPVTSLPSTSSANARYSLPDLVNKWMIIKKYID